MTSSISGATVGRTLFTLIGASVAGPIGGIVGNLTGGLLQAILPGPTDIVSNVLGNVTTEALRKTGNAVAGRLAPQEKLLINHDLQTAFRDAFQEALYDLGGVACFPQAWHQKRDVPPNTVFALTPQGNRLWREENPLAAQVRQCFQDMQRALVEKRLLPLDPPLGQPEASVTQYLDADTPQSLVTAFYDQVLAHFLAGYSTLFAELPAFETHLRTHLLDRTLVHLGEALKQRTPAWRAFNRLMLEGMRDELQALGAGQAEITKRLDDLLTRPEAEGIAGWSDAMADLLSATGQIQKRLDEGFDSITRRVVEQHQEIVTRLDGLLVVTVRIETKVDRVLRILEDGHYIIEGKAAVRIDLPPEPGEPPYKGLQYFDQGDADLFFGRELLTARLTGQLRQHNFLAVVVGASGSGKSSVVRAGLIPALRRGAVLADGTLPPANSTAWPIHIITPTGHPLEALAASLTRDSESVTATATLAADLRADPRSLGLYVRRLLASPRAARSQRLLLVVDQFEELFTLCVDPDERRIFIDGLLNAVGCDSGSQLGGDGSVLNVALRPDCPTTVVITLRADFYHHCGQYANLREALEQSQAYIGPMDQDELRCAIEEPARLGRWEFERGLVDLLLHDVGDEPGALPLLSHALLEIWKHRRGRVMTLESYVESGGVRGAIAKTADAVYLGLTPEQQNIARCIFLRLTKLGEGTQDTRRRVDLAELIPAPEHARAVNAVLKTLTDARLVTTDKDAMSGVETAEVAHEALIREWPRLRGWLAEDRTGLRIHRALTEAAVAWQKLGREPGSLYRGARLAEAGEFAANNEAELNPLERGFLAASQQALAAEVAEREAQRQRELDQARVLAEEQKQRAEAEQGKAEVQRQRAEENAKAARGLRKRAALLAGALVVAALFLAAAIVASVRAQHQTQLTLSRQLAAQAVNHSTDLDLALLLSMEANRLSDALEVRGNLLTELESSPHLITFLHGHTGWVWNVAFSPDGQTLASASDDGSAILWDTSKRDQIRRLLAKTDSSPVVGVAFSPDGQKLATGSDDGAIILWDVATGQAQDSPWSGHDDRVWSLAFSPDGRYLASGGRDRRLLLWEMATGEAIPLVGQGGEAVVRAVAFSPDGRLLAAAAENGTISLWDVATHQRRGQPWHGHTAGTNNGAIASLAFSPDSQTLASGSWDGIILLWDVATGQTHGPMLSHEYRAPISGLAFSPRGQTLASGCVDGTVMLWDTVTGQSIGQPLKGHHGWVNGVAFSPDGQTLASASADHTVILWSVEPSRNRQSLPGQAAPVTQVAFSPDGKTLASAGSDKDIVLWDVTTGQPYGQPFASLAKDSHGDDVNAIAFSPDGQRFAASTFASVVVWDTATRQVLGSPLHWQGWMGGVAFSPDSSQLAAGSQDGNIILWDLEAGQPPTATLQGRPAPIYSLALSPDGRTLALGTLANTVDLWDIATGQQLGALPGHQGFVNAIAFSSDGKLLASGGQDAVILLWDVAAQTIVGRFEGHSGTVNGLAFSPDGGTLASASADKTVLLWDLVTHQRRGEVLEGHTDQVADVAFSPDGRILASSDIDKQLILWDAATGQPIGQPLTSQGGLLRIAFSPDGQTLAVTGQDSTVTLWDVASLQPRTNPLRGHTGAVMEVAFSPDGSMIASSGQDGAVILWDATRGQIIGQPLIAHTNWVNGVAFSPDGRQLFTGSLDGTARVWDVATGQPVGQPLINYYSHVQMVNALAYSPDGKILASAGADGSVLLWDPIAGKILGELLATDAQGVVGLTFSPDGKYLAVGSSDGKVTLWDVATHQQLSQIETKPEDWPRAAAFSHDGEVLALAECAHYTEAQYCDQGQIRLWNLSESKPIGPPMVGHLSAASGIAFSPDDKTLASSSFDGTVILWDLATQQPRFPPMTARRGDVFDIAFSPDSRMLAAVGDSTTITLWDTATRQMSGRPLEGHLWTISSVAFSPDGRTLASGGPDKTVRLWDVATQSPLGEPLQGSSSYVLAVAFSPTGELLASGSCAKANAQGLCSEGEIRLWELESRQQKGAPLIGHSNFVRNVVFSPDGKTLASSSDDHTILLWDIATGQPLRPPLVGHDLDVYALAFSPDGKILASGGRDATVMLWDVAIGQRRGQPLAGHDDTVTGVAFSPDGTILASSGADSTVRLWDATTGQPLAFFSGHTEWVAALAFSHDGEMLASGGDDGAIILWDLSPESWQTRACEIAHRNLTPAEWAQYLPRQKYRKTCSQWPAAMDAPLPSLSDQATPSPVQPTVAAPTPEPGATLPATPFALPERSSEEIAIGQLLLSEDFADSSERWEPGSDDVSRISIHDGRLHVEGSADGRMQGRTSGMRLSNYILQVDTKFEGGPQTSMYGVIVRLIDGDNHYSFELDGKGSYRFRKRANGEKIELIPWTQSDAIEPGKATNTIRIICHGDSLTLLVNGQELSTIQDSAFAAGDFALFVGKFEPDGWAHASFDNLRVWALE